MDSFDKNIDIVQQNNLLSTERIAEQINLIKVALYNCDPDNWKNARHVQHTGKNGSDLFKEITIKVIDRTKGETEPKQIAEAPDVPQDYIDAEDAEDSVN